MVREHRSSVISFDRSQSRPPFAFTVLLMGITPHLVRQPLARLLFWIMNDPIFFRNMNRQRRKYTYFPKPLPSVCLICPFICLTDICIRPHIVSANIIVRGVLSFLLTRSDTYILQDFCFQILFYGKICSNPLNRKIIPKRLMML